MVRPESLTDYTVDECRGIERALRVEFRQRQNNQWARATSQRSQNRVAPRREATRQVRIVSSNEQSAVRPRRERKQVFKML